MCFVAGAGTALPCAVGRLIAATTPPATGSTSLASAWSSSRSQLAVHSGFAFELCGAKTRLRRAAVRDELPHFSTERVGRNHRKGCLMAAEFLKNVGDSVGADCNPPLQWCNRISSLRYGLRPTQRPGMSAWCGTATKTMGVSASASAMRLSISRW